MKADVSRQESEEFGLEVQRLNFNVKFSQFGGVFINLLAQLLDIHYRYHLYLGMGIAFPLR